MHPIAGVIWYAVGRFYEAQDGSLQDLGYFAHLGGIQPLFNSHHPGEASAFFTFRSEPFTARKLHNGDLSLSLDATGSFTLYLNREPCGDFSRPETFSRGEPIATFQRLSAVVGTSVGPIGTNLFSAALISSSTFHFQGKDWNLERLMPHGITQMGVASTTVITPPQGFKAVTPFVGSAMAVGGNVRWP
ncbi:hypothetical protein [Archangium lansingense]|uniref:Uncharacterized protein n=1 Tax=Archangium lansingense TaxID=2995310 RepID=A0ABT4A239_9BACT|nr:hypothetical protein [Archangium lansinium]MCY1075069.1 hypothetical protein [Archangium lansinium]